MQPKHLTRLISLALTLCLLFLPTLSTAESNNTTFNLLLIGYDSYNAEEPGRSDAMILAQVTPQTGDIKLVSFLRDIYAPIEGHGSTRLNAAYYYGGASLLRQTLESCFGVRIDRHFSVNFSLMSDLVDQLGGVEVDVSEEERVQLNSILKFYNKQIGADENDQLLLDSGIQHLSGKQALSFGRIRKLDTDFKRVGRQHRVLLGILKQMTKLDFMSLMNLAAANIDKIDTDIMATDASALLTAMMNASGLRLRSVHVPFDGAYRNATINGMMVLETDFASNAELIRQFLAEE